MTAKGRSLGKNLEAEADVTDSACGSESENKILVETELMWCFSIFPG